MTERGALVVAGTAHVALFAALSLSWSLLRKDIAPFAEPIPVDFVDIADLPTIDRAPKPSIAAAPRETVEEAATPEAETPADTPPPAEVAEAPPAKPKPAPAAKAAAKPKRDLMSLVDKALPDAPRRTKPKDFAQSIEDAIPEAARLDAKTSATLAQAIRDRIYRCWDPAQGGPDYRSISTVLRVRVARDGAVIGRPEVVSQAGATGANAAYGRVARDAAMRAVMNPACSLAGLPPELYDGWKLFELNFDPSIM